MGQRLMDGGKEYDAARHHGERRSENVQNWVEFTFWIFFLQFPASEEENQRDPNPRAHGREEPAHSWEASDDHNGNQQAGAYPGESCGQYPTRTGSSFYMVHRDLFSDSNMPLGQAPPPWPQQQFIMALRNFRDFQNLCSAVNDDALRKAVVTDRLWGRLSPQVSAAVRIALSLSLFGSSATFTKPVG